MKLAISHIFLHLLMYSNCPPHLNYATTLPCENYKVKLDNFKHFAETIQQYNA